MRVCWKTASLALIFVWAIVFGVTYSGLAWWGFGLLITALTIFFTFTINMSAYLREKKFRA